MNATTWDTNDAAPDGFEAAWTARLARCRLANFSVDPAYLRWEAARGNRARATLVDEGGRRAAIVLRETPRGYESGWPWRWQAMLEGDASAGLVPAREDALWLFERCNALAGDRRLMLHLPVAPGGAAPSFYAGATLVKDMRPSEEDLLRSLDGNKRRSINKARKEGHTVTVASSLAQLRTFAELHLVVEARHGYRRPPLAESPGPAEAWREWELPWQVLYVAEAGGRVVGGSGFGLLPGGMMDYRVNASTPEALKSGVNALLAWEALRLGREAGYRAMNWGGVTTFKLELRGERVESHCWLGGGPLWAVPNRVVAGTKAARAKLATLVRPRAARGN